MATINQLFQNFTTGKKQKIAAPKIYWK